MQKKREVTELGHDSCVLRLQANSPMDANMFLNGRSESAVYTAVS